MRWSGPSSHIILSYAHCSPSKASPPMHMTSLVLPRVSWNLDQRNRRRWGLCPWDQQLMARKLNGYLNFHSEIGAAAKPDVPSRLKKLCGPAGAGEGTGVSQLVLTSCKFYWECGRNFTWNIHDFNHIARSGQQSQETSQKNLTKQSL